MILKYKGVVGDWFFAEGTIIRTAIVLTKGLSGTDELLDRIREDTGICAPLIIGNAFGYPFVVAVSVDLQEYAIATEAYILNDNGKTIERLI